MWRRQRLWVLFLVLVGTGASTLLLFTHRFSADLNSYIWLAYIPSGLLLGAVLTYYRRRSYAETTPNGLKVSSLLSSLVIDYEDIRGARVQPLKLHFQEERRRQIRPVARPLLEKPALFVRLKAEEADLAQIRRKLGSQLAASDMVVLPIPDPDAFAWDVTSRLPDRGGVNLGGQKRRKRR